MARKREWNKYAFGATGCICWCGMLREDRCRDRDGCPDWKAHVHAREEEDAMFREQRERDNAPSWKMWIVYALCASFPILLAALAAWRRP